MPNPRYVTKSCPYYKIFVQVFFFQYYFKVLVPFYYKFYVCVFRAAYFGELIRKPLRNNVFLNNFYVNDPIGTKFSEIIWALIVFN